MAFVGHPRYLPALEARGFLCFAVDGHFAGAPLERRPLLVPSQLDEDRVLREYYATEVPRRRVARNAELYDTWAPDLVIRHEVDFAAAVLTDELDIAHAVVLVLAAGSFIRPQVVAGPLDQLRAERGHRADPDLAALPTRWHSLRSDASGNGAEIAERGVSANSRFRRTQADNPTIR